MVKLKRQLQRKKTTDFEAANRHYEAGLFAQAELLCQKILKTAPGHADAWNLAARAALAVGQNDTALRQSSRALQLQPHNPAFHNTLGVACLNLARPDEAAAHFRQALALHEAYPEAHNNLAGILKDQGDLPEAERHAQRALALRPGFPEALINLGVIQQGLGKWQEGVSCYRQVLATQPENFLALFQLGNILGQHGDLTEAARLYQRAVTIRPDFAEAHFHLGGILRTLGAFEQALSHYQRALASRADFPEAQLNLGDLLQSAGRLQEAEALYRQALTRRPDFLEAWNNLGGILTVQGKLEEAAACYRQALDIRPDFPEVSNNMGRVLEDQGLIKEALNHYRRALSLRPDYPGAHDNLLLGLHYDSDATAVEIEDAHRDWGCQVATRIGRPAGPWDNNRDPDRPLRIGFVSADLREHSVAYYLASVLEAFASREVAVFCYCNNIIQDGMTERLRRCATGWRDIFALSDADAAQLIRQDRIDILVDLAGHTGNNRLRLFASKPAPIQATWLGYPDTTGLAAMDYRITDAIADPPASPDWHSEELIRLPEGFLCYGEQPGAPEPSGPGCVESGVITFGCFNNNAKINDRVIARWAEILNQVPDSRLLLKNNALHSKAVRDAWQERLAQHDVSLDRLELIPRVASYSEHLAIYGRMDVALDVFPYNGTTTTCEAMWMGVPVVVLRGDRHVSRVGASLLTRVGLTELIAETPAEYVAKAVALGGDRDKLIRLRHELRERMRSTALGDAPRFTRTLEQAFRRMWHCWLHTPPPPATGGTLDQGPAATAPNGAGLALQPGAVETLYSLADVQHGQGKWEAAAASYRQVLAIQPDHHLARFNMANILSAHGQLPEAVEQFQRVVALRPDFAEAHLNLACALHHLGEFDQALAHYQQTVALRPDIPEAHNSLGLLLSVLGRFEESIDSLRQAIALRPDFAAAHNNLAGAYQNQGRIAEALALFRQALRLQPDVAAFNNLLLCLHYSAEVTPAEIEAAHREFGAWMAARQAPETPCPWPNKPDPERPLRVGFVSADFREHAVAYFLRDVFVALDPRQVELFCYANNAHTDGMTDLLRQSAVGWQEIVGLSDTEAAARIREDQIDILVDLAGHTGNNRLPLFIHKPAPIQVTWLGYPDTTGLAAIDYRLTDPIADPPDSPNWHSEELFRLPEGFLSFGVPSAAPEPSLPPCLASGVTTFGCFNNNAKITPQAVAQWAEILSLVPNSRLLLKNQALTSPVVRAMWQEQFQAHGVDLDRLELLPRVASYSDHLATYGRLDIALDVFPYNGTTTTCEAMWMGVPVVVLRGDRHVSRVGASLLTRVGMKELIAETPAEYVAKAVALANDREKLKRLRHELRDRMRATALGDAPRFTRTLEQAFRQMWHCWLRTEAKEKSPSNNNAGNDNRDEHLALFDRGNFLSGQGQPAAAAAQFRRAVELRPDFAEAHLNLACALHQMGDLNQALGHYQQTIALRPEIAEAYSGLGLLLQGRGSQAEAEASYRHALALRPDFPEAWSNLGTCLVTQGKQEEAAACYQKALALQPDHPAAHNNLGGLLVSQGLISEGLTHYRRALALQPDSQETNDNLLGALLYAADVNAAEIEAAHRDWGRRVAARIAPGPEGWENDPDPTRRLRVGFVSADFREHSVAYFLIDVFAAFDPGQVALFCYANSAITDATTARFRQVAEGWQEIAGMSDTEVEQLIRADGIDILVDLAGHTGGNRLLVFARKPAPIQVTWLGYPDTTGLDAIDYRLTDPIADPFDSPNWHSEELFRLPDGFLCFGVPCPAPKPAASPCLASGVITFGCFNNNAKITPQAVACWAEILRLVPGSRLLLKNKEARLPAVRESWRQQFQAHGVGLDRLELLPRVASYAEHLTIYGQVDVALDVFPYNGTTTTCEAMWMGVPVVVLRGDRHVSRVGASLLTRVGMKELIAENPAEYVAKAVALAGDRERLKRLRPELRDRLRGSALGDAGRFARSLEHAFREMWRRRLAGG